jgi:hypothetical protein
MFRNAVFAVVALAVAPQALTYRPTQSAPKPVEGEYTYKFEISGPDALVKQIVASNPVLSVQEIRATRKGQLKVNSAADNSSRIEITFDSAHVTGTVQGKTFQYDFVRDSPPPSLDPAKEPARVISWGLTMARRNYLVTPTGEYSLSDRTQDAQAEASAILMDGPVQLPPRALKVGETWTSEWTGKGRQKANGASFNYKQTARLEELTEGPSPRARISYTTTAVMNVPEDKNPQGEATSLEAKGSIVLDVTSGTLLASDSSGSITTDLKKPGLKMVRRMTSKFKVP